MAFDQSTRNRLQRFVTEARTLLADEFTRQLQATYGMNPNTGEVADIDTLTGLTPHQQETAQLLRDTLSHYLANAEKGKEKAQRTAALGRIVREQAFTILNRLAALRMSEARGFLIESIAKGYESKGFQLFHRLAGTSLGETGAAYQHYVYSLFDEFSLDLAVLFDRFSVQGRLFPSHTKLLELLGLINHDEINLLWIEDETVGWIYQYFNSIEERRQMRAESQAPRNSRELAVRNQFFTPRYVVEFLTDNTLGRIWYEMTQGNTGLKTSCKYLVRRPNELFLAEHDTAPEQLENLDLSQEQLLQQTVYIDYRKLKDPRDIRMLDPACGSMHFGLYAFDLFEAIYSEAWDIEIAQGAEAFIREPGRTTLTTEYADKAEFLRHVPRLIIEHNIHGVDIDPRAAQIAGLSLWLRAHNSWQKLGIKPVDRPKIQRSNIVCAEPMPGEKALLQEFTATLKPTVLGQLVEVIFEKMALAGEAGSLLKIEEEIQNAIAEAKQTWQDENKGLFQFADFAKIAKQRGELDFDVSDINDESFWEQAEQKILDALQEYAEKASIDEIGQRRLFSEDAAKGFAFIELCRKRFDVVLMNPPFGDASIGSSKYLQKEYSTWNKNLLCAFLERGWMMNTEAGKIAAIFDRTAIVKSTYEDFRRKVLIPNNRISTQIDLGWDVLDANVEVIACVLSKLLNRSLGYFFDIRSSISAKKGNLLQNLIIDLKDGLTSSDTVVTSSSSFSKLPNAVIGYDFPTFLRKAFNEFSSLEDSGVKAFQGFALKSDKHFRVWWELDNQTSHCVNRMFNGAGFSPYANSLLSCVISNVEPENLLMDSSTRKSGLGSHRLPGVCFGKRGEYFCAHILPAGHIFTVEGQSIPINDHDTAIDIVAYLNTSVVRFALNKFCGQHKYSGYVNLLPYVPILDSKKARNLIIESITSIRTAQQRDELQPNFIAIAPGKNLNKIAYNISELINHAWKNAEDSEIFCDLELFKQLDVSKVEIETIQRFQKNQPRRESAIEGIDIIEDCLGYAARSIFSYAIGVIFGRWDIRLAIHENNHLVQLDLFGPLPKCPPGQLQNDQGLPITETDFYKLKQEEGWDYPIQIVWGGVLVDEPGHSLNIQEHIHKVLDVIWPESWQQIEHEALDVLGVNNLSNYLQKPTGFFADHLKTYSKNRRLAPIYWQLQSLYGSSSIWIYYHSLTEQTLYGCVNNLIETKIDSVNSDLKIISNTLSRDKAEEEKFSSLTDLKAELEDFRDELLRISKFWKPNLNDGVQITAAPLWRLFQHKPWQKKLKETWEQLEAGEYDWAHLAYSIWPARVLSKCHKDRSLAIAHEVEQELWHEVQVIKGRSKSPVWEWQPKPLSEAELTAYIQSKIQA